MFHTKNKHGVVIHPTSVFASDPEVLHVPEDDNGEMGKHPPLKVTHVKSIHLIPTGEGHCVICSSSLVWLI